VRGIPRFVGSEGYAGSFGFQWTVHAKTQLDSYTGLPLSRNRLFGVSGWSSDLAGETVLEVGSGAGRFTEVLQRTGATIVSVDVSSAVDANYLNNGMHPNVFLLQADLSELPLPKRYFDKVLCLGVLQHTPNPSESFHALVEHVKPGGELVIDVYAKRLRSLLHWKYVLRPITRTMDKKSLYGLISWWVPMLLPLSVVLRKLLGRAGHRLIPILEYSHWGLPAALNREWATLDTFDMYSPAHDHPQSLRTVRGWFEQQGFEQIDVRYGPNGIVAKGRSRAES
jgi:SAM-dependent methyltransferase